MTTPSGLPRDTRYPIYSITARFVQDGDYPPEERARMKWWPNDPGQGRIWNSVHHTKMYREDPGQAEVGRWAREDWWPKARDQERRVVPGKAIADDHPGEPIFEVVLTHHESWCCSWFEHYTFDVGQSDAETLASFGEYVDRHAFYQDWPHGDDTDHELKRCGIEHRVCLMGAEDRWRWCGATPDGAAETRSAPPCRCEHCKAQGVLRIGH